MTRHLDVKHEVREAAKRDALVRALEFGLVGALSTQGIELVGLSIKYDAFNCLLTLKADVAGVRSVCFVGSDTIVNVLLKADSMASNEVLKWKQDQYHITSA